MKALIFSHKVKKMTAGGRTDTQGGGGGCDRRGGGEREDDEGKRVGQKI